MTLKERIHAEITAAMDEIEGNDKVGALVVTGAPPAFAASRRETQPEGGVSTSRPPSSMRSGRSTSRSRISYAGEVAGRIVKQPG